MCLVESHLDADMKMIHRSSTSSQEKTEGWQVKLKEIQERDKILDHLYEKPLEYAEKRVGREKG